MRTYTVTVKPVEETEAGAFVGINFGEDGYAEFVNFTVDGNEIHAIYTERDIDRALDASRSVLSYTVIEE